jgi:hypothetical protein
MAPSVIECPLVSLFFLVSTGILASVVIISGSLNGQTSKNNRQLSIMGPRTIKLCQDELHDKYIDAIAKKNAKEAEARQRDEVLERRIEEIKVFTIE